MITLQIQTSTRIDFVDITQQIQMAVTDAGIESGTVTIFVPHTTCAVTINEHADPAVVKDIAEHLVQLIPYDKRYRHREGNSDSHIKTSLTGSSETVIIENGHLVLGTWQGIFLCDYDGPRNRKVYVKIIAG